MRIVPSNHGGLQPHDDKIDLTLDTKEFDKKLLLKLIGFAILVVMLFVVTSLMFLNTIIKLSPPWKYVTLKLSSLFIYLLCAIVVIRVYAIVMFFRVMHKAYIFWITVSITILVLFFSLTFYLLPAATKNKNKLLWLKIRLFCIYLGMTAFPVLYVIAMFFFQRGSFYIYYIREEFKKYFSRDDKAKARKVQEKEKAETALTEVKSKRDKFLETCPEPLTDNRRRDFETIKTKIKELEGCLKSKEQDTRLVDAKIALTQVKSKRAKFLETPPQPLNYHETHDVETIKTKIKELEGCLNSKEQDTPRKKAVFLKMYLEYRLNPEDVHLKKFFNGEPLNDIRSNVDIVEEFWKKLYNDIESFRSLFCHSFILQSEIVLLQSEIDNTTKNMKRSGFGLENDEGFFSFKGSKVTLHPVYLSNDQKASFQYVFGGFLGHSQNCDIKISPSYFADDDFQPLKRKNSGSYIDLYEQYPPTEGGQEF